jgi:hypothetical protein
MRFIKSIKLQITAKLMLNENLNIFYFVFQENSYHFYYTITLQNMCFESYELLNHYLNNEIFEN